MQRIWVHDTLWLELFLGFEVIILGIALILPTNTFTSVKTFDFLASVCTENVWGGIILGLGIIYYILLCFDNYKLRRLGTLGLVFFWGFMATGYYLGNPDGAGWVMFLGFTIGALICRVNIGAEKL